MRTILHSQITACPHVIIDLDHYPDTQDAPCKCFDRSAVEMEEWGYSWDEEAGRWS